MNYFCKLCVVGLVFQIFLIKDAECREESYYDDGLESSEPKIKIPHVKTNPSDDKFTSFNLGDDLVNLDSQNSENDQLVDDSLEDTFDNEEENEDYEDPDGDMMEAASNIVFRPLFRYRKQQIEKNRVFRDRKGNIYSSPDRSHVLQQPHSRPPPQVLVYDKQTGAYYPLKNANFRQ